MAITDAQNRPSNNQSLAVGAGTTVSTDSIDLLTANRNVGRSHPMRMQVVVGTALAGGTNVRVEVITSASANLSSPTVIATGPTVATGAATAAGAELLDVSIPGTTQRYLGVQYVTTGIHTAGTVTAHLLAETDNNTYVTMNTGL